MIINIYENSNLIDELDSVIDDEVFDSVIDYDEFLERMNTEKENESECHFSEVEDLINSVNKASSFKDLKSAVVDILDKVEELDANSFGDLEHLKALDDKTDNIENDIKKVKAQLEEYRILKSDISNLRIELENLRSVIRGTARDWNDISKKVDEQGIIINNLVFETKFNSNAIVSHCLNHGSTNEKKLYSWVPKDYDFNSKDRVNRYEKWKKENGLKKEEKDDNVNHPKHYTQGKYEVIDFIHEYGKNVNIGNSIKYISRAGVKDEDKYVEDLEKALWYLHDYNNPKPKQHIDPVDYTKDKKLPDELVAVIMDICKKDYKLAEVNLSDYLNKLKNEDTNNG